MARATGEWIESLPAKYRDQAQAEIYGYAIGPGLTRTQCGQAECVARLLHDLLGTDEMRQRFSDAAHIAAIGGHPWMVNSLLSVLKNLPPLTKSRLRRAERSNAPYTREQNIPVNQPAAPAT